MVNKLVLNQGSLDIKNAGADTAIAISNTNTGANNVATINDYGTGSGLVITKKSSTGNAGDILKIVAEDVNSCNGISINTANSSGAGIYVHVAATATGISVFSSGGPAIDIQQTAPDVALNIGHTNNGDVLVMSKSGTNAGNCISITNAGTGSGIYITGSKSLGVALNAADVFIKKTGLNDALVNYSHWIEVTNASSGDIVGMRFNLNSSTGKEQAFSFNGSEYLASVAVFTQVGFIRINIGGVEYYIPYGTHA